VIIRHRPGLEAAAILLLLFSAMLDPIFTLGLAVALLAGACMLVYLGRDPRGQRR
jgi:hypothetical protein